MLDLKALPSSMSLIYLRMLDLKGALNDILENIDIKLDPMFISSLIHDLIKVRFSLLPSGCFIYLFFFLFLLGFFPNVGKSEGYIFIFSF